MKYVLQLICLIVILFSPVLLVYAQSNNFVSITNLPSADGSGPLTAEGFVQIAYNLAIVVASLLAVIKIIYGGVQYMLSDVITDKGQAKKDIQGAIFGLIIVLAAVFILELVNPNLAKLNLFTNAPPVGNSTGTGSSALTSPNN